VKPLGNTGVVVPSPELSAGRSPTSPQPYLRDRYGFAEGCVRSPRRRARAAWRSRSFAGIEAEDQELVVETDRAVIPEAFPNW
jgi:hypothetical protein